jgi:hypothetical protein
MPEQLARTTNRPGPAQLSVAATSSRVFPPVGGVGTAPEKRLPAIVRYLDVVLLALAVPLAVALGAPVLGCAIGAGAWVLQRILAQADRRWIEGKTELRTRFGVNLVESFGRIWLLAGAIVIAAVAGGRSDGLAASLAIFGAYSIAFAVRLVDGRPGGPRP